MRGFTLIEALLYMGLFGLIMVGAVAVSYQLITSSSVLDAKNIAQEEGNFIIGKLDWALIGTSTQARITTPAVGSYSNSLAVTRADGLTFDARVVNGAIEMRENGGSYASTTTNNVRVTSLRFYHIPATGTGPEGITASTTINGNVFTITKYIRK